MNPKWRTSLANTSNKWANEHLPRFGNTKDSPFPTFIIRLPPPFSHTRYRLQVWLILFADMLNVDYKYVRCRLHYCSMSLTSMFDIAYSYARHCLHIHLPSFTHTPHSIFTMVKIMFHRDETLVSSWWDTGFIMMRITWDIRLTNQRRTSNE